MAKFQSPLLGYNNNVRHRGRVFHIQTEDSGVNHPHIITHLFMDGGRILKSVKKSYAEHVGSDGMSETVRVMMKEQHKAMFIALRDGQFDELVDPGGVKKPSGAVVAPVVPAAATATAAAATEPLREPAEPSLLGPLSVPQVAVPSSESAPRSAPRAPADVLPSVSLNVVAAVPVATLSGTNEVATVAAAEVAAVESKASPPTSPNPPRSEELPPRTIDDNRQLGVASYSAALGPVSGDQPLPPEIEALLREDPPPPQSVTDPVMSMPARLQALAREEVEDSPNTTREPAPRHSMRAPESSERNERSEWSGAPSRSEGSGKSSERSGGSGKSSERSGKSSERSGKSSERRSAQELTLDFDALERDSSPGLSPMFQTSDLPPPPKNLFAKEPRTGAYSTVESDAHDSTRAPASRPQPPGSSRSPQAKPPSQTQKPISEGRYAPARPAAIFGAAAKQTSPSIFSDDLVSDKSLDEVILSYLAEDLDPPRRK